jgi:hypothetical protein
MTYIIEGINKEGELITRRFARIMGESIERTAKYAATLLGLLGSYVWYKEEGEK